METVDDLTLNKLIEESKKNKKLIYHVMQYKSDRNIFQSIKDEQTTSGTSSIEVTKKSDFILRSTKPVNSSNIILNKRSKDNQARRRQCCSPLRLPDVQILPPQPNQHEKILDHQRRELHNPPPPIVSLVKPISTSKPYPLQENYQREHLKTCHHSFSSHTQVFDQSQAMQNTTPPNEEHSSSSQLVMDETQVHQQLDYKMPTMRHPIAPPNQVRQTHLENPIHLVKKVHTSENFNQRSKSVCNPWRGHAYVSPHTRAYYPPLPLDRAPLLLENNLPLVDLTSQPYCCSQTEQQQLQLQRQQKQQPSPSPPPAQISLLQQYRPSQVVSPCVTLEPSMHTETLQTSTSNGNPISHTSNNNAFSYNSNIAANVQPVQLRPARPPPPTYAKDTQSQAVRPGKEYSGRRMNHAVRNNLQYGHIAHQPTASDMRMAYTRTSSSDQMWSHVAHQYSVPTRSHGTQHHTASMTQDWTHRFAKYEQTSGWPQ